MIDTYFAEKLQFLRRHKWLHRSSCGRRTGSFQFVREHQQVLGRNGALMCTQVLANLISDCESATLLL